MMMNFEIKWKIKLFDFKKTEKFLKIIREKILEFVFNSNGIE